MMAEHPKVDFKKSMKGVFSASSTEFEEVTLSKFNFLMVDGQGAPGTSQAYLDALGILYPAAYGIKFYSKLQLKRDYVVPPLEGLWWSDNLDAFTENRRDEWRWTMMIMLPDWISADHYGEAMDTVQRKKSDLDFTDLRMDSLEEGRSLQKLHIGSYADEAPVLKHLHDELMPSQGLTFNGHHHEIYLGDPRKVAPEKLRTILRQPVKPI
ncbi:GyrI-like domain-containing protein [Pontixanthobacter sp. CEM42]|uniref:GyrI-like domain-containing protein n=1 Tax=Pontixanthobacter sp. CEM42 TaxID=2792077 RepID=UPI001AE0714F|nr:GyrI-like domain-containing protein [Pontixanthobacter sp. CEM42]